MKRSDGPPNAKVCFARRLFKGHFIHASQKPDFLGQGIKREGSRRPWRGLPAQEGLATGDPAGGEAYDRLVMDEKLAVLQGLVEILFQFDRGDRIDRMIWSKTS